MEGSSQKMVPLCHKNGHWMSQLPEKVWDVPLSNLSLPGSHDAMTYCLDKKSAVTVNESKLLQFVDKCLPCIVHPIIMKWSITQVIILNELLLNEMSHLNLLARCLLNSTGKRFPHTASSTLLVEDTLWEIWRWLLTHPWEILILACRNFDGLTEEHHCHLISCIKRIFCCKLCPKNVSIHSCL
uniref:Uncharacterized protein n=1 Tax=Sphenodon punctatus TaxID=8508 RepID=A0A8D0GJP9_SPHPU